MNGFGETAGLGADHRKLDRCKVYYDLQSPRERMIKLKGEEQLRGTVRADDVSNMGAPEKRATDE